MATSITVSTTFTMPELTSLLAYWSSQLGVIAGKDWSTITTADVTNAQAATARINQILGAMNQMLTT